jgi:2-amino-4-hydroxy-6-hydroxymethyldihydropteridine diphosphokinase
VIQQAGEMIRDRFGKANVAFSQLYRTPAIGGPQGQDDFYNAVATINSNESAFGIWQSLNAIEQSLGRWRRHRWEARRIDLDVLLHASERHWTPRLKVPHPRMITRTFVLEPACEIAAEWIEPVTGRSIEDLHRSLVAIRQNFEQGKKAIHFLILCDRAEKAHAIREAFTRHSQSAPVVAPRANPSKSAAPDSLEIQLSPSRHLTFKIHPLPPRPIESSWFENLRQSLAQFMLDWQSSDPIHFLAVAGVSPDPSVIHWEDYCRPWAELLGLVANPHESTREVVRFRGVPKYLLSADDPDWAAHELQAAMEAMTCRIQADGEFFSN